MGTRKLENIWIGEYRRAVATVAQMIERGWDVIAKCETCGLMTVVSLPVIVKVKGPDAVLWNQKERCKKLGCRGFVHFEAHVPRGRGGYEPLTAPWPED